LHDRVGLALQILLLALVLLLGGFVALVEPLDGFVNSSLKSGLVSLLELASNVLVLESVAKVVGVRFETVLGGDTGSGSLVFSLVLLSFGDHSFDIFLGKTALVVCDSDLVGLASSLVSGADVQDGVGVNVERNLNLRDTARSRRNASKLELAEKVVILGAGTFTFEDLNQDTGLVIGVGGEDLGLLGGDGSVTLDEGSHDTASGFNTEREGSDIEKKEILGLLGGVTSENGSLDGGTVGDGFIRVDGLVGLLAVEEVRNHLLDLGDTGGTTDEDDIVDGGLVDLGVTEDLLDGLHGGTEEILVEFLETGTGQGSVEVNTFEQGVDFDGGLCRRGEGTFSTLAGGTETTNSTGVSRDILLVLALEFLDKVVDKTVIEIFTTKMGVTSGGLDFEDTVLDGQERDIEGTTTKIEDEDVALTLNLLIETIGNGSSSRLVDDTENVHTRDHTGILGSLTLGVVEVSGDGNHSVGDGGTEISFSGFLHLEEDHGRDFFRSEGLLLTLVFDLDLGLAVLVDDLERPVLHIRLDLLVGETTTDKTLGIENGVVRVHGDLVLGGITDQTLRVGESDI